MKINNSHPHSQVDPSQLSLEKLAGNTKLSDEERVGEVSRQFEAVLLRQILQDIRKPVLASTASDSTVNGIYSDMINNQLADSISRSGAFGLARGLQGQLSHQVLPHSQETLSPSPKSS
jgi:flagellar protein FlgJ